MGVRPVTRVGLVEERLRFYGVLPVVELEGRKIMKYRVDEARLARLLDAAR